MNIRRAKYIEIQECFKIALECSLASKVPEFVIDEDQTLRVISDMFRGEYFRVIEKDDRLVGWIAASKSNVQLYNSKPCLTVISYQCILKSKSAVNALIDIHEHLFDFGTSKGYELVVTNSVLNSKKSFNRILTQEGWLDRNGILLKKTHHYKDGVKPLSARRPETIGDMHEIFMGKT
jgi:hypothetical protein